MPAFAVLTYLLFILSGIVAGSAGDCSQWPTTTAPVNVEVGSGTFVFGPSCARNGTNITFFCSPGATLVIDGWIMTGGSVTLVGPMQSPNVVVSVAVLVRNANITAVDGPAVGIVLGSSAPTIDAAVVSDVTLQCANSSLFVATSFIQSWTANVFGVSFHSDTFPKRGGTVRKLTISIVGSRLAAIAPHIEAAVVGGIYWGASDGETNFTHTFALTDVLFHIESTAIDVNVGRISDAGESVTRGGIAVAGAAVSGVTTTAVSNMTTFVNKATVTVVSDMPTVVAIAGVAIGDGSVMTVTNVSSFVVGTNFQLSGRCIESTNAVAGVALDLPFYGSKLATVSTTVMYLSESTVTSNNQMFGDVAFSVAGVALRQRENGATINASTAYVVASSVQLSFWVSEVGVSVSIAVAGVALKPGQVTVTNFTAIADRLRVAVSSSNGFGSVARFANAISVVGVAGACAKWESYQTCEDTSAFISGTHLYAVNSALVVKAVGVDALAVSGIAFLPSATAVVTSTIQDSMANITACITPVVQYWVFVCNGTTFSGPPGCCQETAALIDTHSVPPPPQLPFPLRAVRTHTSTRAHAPRGLRGFGSATHTHIPRTKAPRAATPSHSAATVSESHSLVQHANPPPVMTPKSPHNTARVATRTVALVVATPNATPQSPNTALPNATVTPPPTQTESWGPTTTAPTPRVVFVTTTRTIHQGVTAATAVVAVVLPAAADFATGVQTLALLDGMPCGVTTVQSPSPAMVPFTVGAGSVTVGAILGLTILVAVTAVLCVLAAITMSVVVRAKKSQPFAAHLAKARFPNLALMMSELTLQGYCFVGMEAVLADDGDRAAGATALAIAAVIIVAHVVLLLKGPASGREWHGGTSPPTTTIPRPLHWALGRGRWAPRPTVAGYGAVFAASRDGRVLAGLMLKLLRPAVLGLVAAIPATGSACDARLWVLAGCCVLHGLLTIALLPNRVVSLNGPVALTSLLLGAAFATRVMSDTDVSANCATAVMAVSGLGIAMIIVAALVQRRYTVRTPTSSDLVMDDVAAALVLPMVTLGTEGGEERPDVAVVNPLLLPSQQHP